MSLANLLSEDSAVKSEYMEAQRDSEVYALVGEHVIPVGEVKRGQLIQVFPADAEYYEFKFGHGTGFIDKDDVRELKKSRKVQDDLGELNKPLTNQNLITQKRSTFTPRRTRTARSSARWKATCATRSSAN